MYVSDSDARRALTLIADLADLKEPDALTGVVLQEIPRLIPGEVVGFNTIDLETVSYDLLVVSDQVVPDPAGLMQPHLSEDPFARAAASARGQPLNAQPRPAFRLSDICSIADWMKTDLYNLAYKPYGFMHQMASGVGIAGSALRSYAVVRGRRDFSDRERDLFTLFSGELVRLHRRADADVRIHALASAAQSIASIDRRAVAAIDARGELLALNESAIRLMKIGKLKDEVWLRRLLDRSQPPTLVSTHNVVVGAVPMQVRVIPSADLHMRCLLIFDTLPTTATGRTHLTSRERDVLGLVAKGYTAGSAGRNLGLSSRTIEKYLARIYKKLEVRDRVSAVLRAKDLGLLELE